MTFCSHTFQNLGLLLWSKFFPLRLASSFERTQIRKRNFPCCKSCLPNKKGGNYVHIRVISLGNVFILLKSFAISFPRHFKVQMLGLSFLIAQGQFYYLSGIPRVPNNERLCPYQCSHLFNDILYHFSFQA